MLRHLPKLLLVLALVSACEDEGPTTPAEDTTTADTDDTTNADTTAEPQTDATSEDTLADDTASTEDLTDEDVTSTEDLTNEDATSTEDLIDEEIVTWPPSPLEDTYRACSGNPFYPESCLDESCIDAGLERRVYDIWRQTFMNVHGLTEAQMLSRIALADVELSDGPSNVTVRIDYIFVLDWVRSRQNEVVWLSSYPMNEEPTDESIASTIEFELEASEQFDLSAVASLDTVETALADCAQGVSLMVDWCHINFRNVSGELQVRGIGPTEGENECINASINVATAESLRCDTEPCSIP